MTLDIQKMAINYTKKEFFKSLLSIIDCQFLTFKTNPKHAHKSFHLLHIYKKVSHIFSI